MNDDGNDDITMLSKKITELEEDLHKQNDLRQQQQKKQEDLYRATVCDFEQTQKKLQDENSELKQNVESWQKKCSVLATRLAAVLRDQNERQLAEIDYVCNQLEDERKLNDGFLQHLCSQFHIELTPNLAFQSPTAQPREKEKPLCLPALLVARHEAVIHAMKEKQFENESRCAELQNQLYEAVAAIGSIAAPLQRAAVALLKGEKMLRCTERGGAVSLGQVMVTPDDSRPSLQNDLAESDDLWNAVGCIVSDSKEVIIDCIAALRELPDKVNVAKPMKTIAMLRDELDGMRSVCQESISILSSRLQRENQLHRTALAVMTEKLRVFEAQRTSAILEIEYRDSQVTHNETKEQIRGSTYAQARAPSLVSPALDQDYY